MLRFLSIDRSQALYGFLLIFISTSILYISTSWGPGTSPDSVEYLLAAESIANPNIPIDINTHWAPMYPVLLAATISLVDNLIASGRWLHIVLFGFNTFLFYLVTIKLFNISNYLRVMATLVFALLPVSLGIHYMMWSEVPFISTLLLSVLALYKWYQEQSLRSLLHIGILLTLLCLFRYAGVAFVGAFCILIFFISKHSLKHRLLSTFLLAICSILPTFLFMLITNSQSNTTSTRHFAIHIVDWERVITVPKIIISWFTSMPTIFSILMAISIVYSLFCLFRQSSFKSNSIQPKPIAIHLISIVFTYIIFLFTSISFFDYYSHIQSRILFPLWPLILLIILAGLQGIKNHKYRTIAASLIFVPLLAWGIPISLDATIFRANSGFGYFSPGFRQQEIIAVLNVPQTKPIYSNAPNVLQIYFGIYTEELPRLIDIINAKPYPDYEEKMNILIDQCLNGEIQIVYFQAFAWREYYPKESVLLDKLASVILYRGPDGIIFDAEILQIIKPPE